MLCREDAPPRRSGPRASEHPCHEWACRTDRVYLACCIGSCHKLSYQRHDLFVTLPIQLACITFLIYHNFKLKRTLVIITTYSCIHRKTSTEIDGCIYIHVRISQRIKRRRPCATLASCPFLVTVLCHHCATVPYRHGWLHLNASVSVFYAGGRRSSSSSPLLLCFRSLMMNEGEEARGAAEHCTDDGK